MKKAEKSKKTEKKSQTEKPQQTEKKLTRAAWDKFVTSHPEANFLQSWDFYEFYKSLGHEITRRVFYDKEGKKIIAAYAGEVESAKRGRFLAIAGGPILDWKDKRLVKKVFADMAEEGKRLKCTFVRVRPQYEETEKSLNLMKSLGLKPAPIYLSVEYAGVLDLEKSEAEILANASQGLRRKLRKAEKNNITIEKSDKPEVVKTFYEIQLETARRQNFYAFSEEFLTKQFKAFAKHNEVTMYTAKLGQEILAQNFIIFYGNEASYHYGVSSDLGTRYSAAPLLHMEAMRDARERGITRYNFWGIVGEHERKHRFYGVSEFKRSFGITELKYTEAHDLILNKPKYLKTLLIEKTRKKIRHV